MAGKWRRLRALADPWLQGRFCVRVGIYWICCLMTVAVVLGWLTAFDAQAVSSHTWLSAFWMKYGFVLVAPLLVLPFIWVDAIVFTNRIIGPMVRLRNAMHRLAEGEPVGAVNFRKGDLIDGMDRDFNAIVQRLENPDATHHGAPDNTSATEEVEEAVTL